MHSPRGWVAAPLLALCLLAISGAQGPARASAATAQPGHGVTPDPNRVHQARGVVPRRPHGSKAATTAGANPQCTACKPPLLFKLGAPVAGGLSGSPGQVTVTPVFWAPSGYSFTSTYRSIVNGYLQNVAAASGQTSNVFATNTEYYQQGTAPGSPIKRIGYSITAGPELDDASAFPAQGGATGCVADTGLSACVSDAGLAAELNAFVAAQGQPIDDSHIYAVMFPSGVETCQGAGPASGANACSTNVYCAYHSGSGPPYLLYANQPFPDLAHCADPWNGAQSPNGDAYADAQVSLISHEVSEAITDWAGAWMDVNGYENGDECAYVYGAPLGSTGGANTAYNQVIGGGKYYTQEEFSNAAFAAGAGDPTTTGGVKVPGCVAQEKPVACTGATLTALPASPAASGASVQLTASAVCPGVPTFRFWVQSPVSSPVLVQDYSTSNVYTWNTTGLAVGSYTLQVDARGQGSTSAVEASASAPYQLVTVPCTAFIAPSHPSPAGTGAGSSVVFTASSSGCGNPRYRFWVAAPGGAWKIAQDYTNGSATYAWQGSTTAGLFRFEADVRDAAHTTAYDAVVNTNYQISACSAATLTSSLQSPQPPGTSITLTGAATCLGTANFRFWVRPPGGAWAIKQDYSTAGTLAWAPQLAGAYGLEVDVRDAGASAGYETVSNLTYVAGAPPCTRPVLTANPPGPQPSGTTVTLAATTTSCPVPNYRFWIKAPGGAWQATAYTASNQQTYGPLGPGLYSFEVDVRAQGETVAYDAVTNVQYQLNGCTAVSISYTPAGAISPNGAYTLQANAACPSGPVEYRWWYRTSTSAWKVIQAYQLCGQINGLVYNGCIYPWNTAGLAHGTTCYFEVDVREQGSPADYEATVNLAYTLS